MIEPRSGGWRALFFGSNGELVWWTEIYNRLADAEHAVNLARQFAGTAPLYYH